MNHKLYYYANQVYQYSFAKPLYDILGGTFLVNRFRRFLRFRWYLRHWGRVPVEIRDIKSLRDFRGVVISESNSVIHHDSDLCTTIFLGHGTGDKKYGGYARNLLSYDYFFISGEKHLAKLRDVGLELPEEKLLKVGNPRFDDYVNKKIDRNTYADYLGIRDRNRKTVLYAPTWRWGNGTLLRYYKKLCSEVTKEFNLIIRPHFHERRFIPTMKAWVRWKGLQHVYFSNPANIVRSDTMHDFAISDMLVSDTSSVLYEYLITGNPILILESGYTDLHTMPKKLDVTHLAAHYQEGARVNLLDAIKATLSHADRKAYRELLHSCFYFNDGQSVRRMADFIQSLPTY